MNDPILYGYFRSTAAHRVRIALNLKRLPVAGRFVHLRKGQQNQFDYRKVNPAGMVPYWVDNDFAFGQSLAIIEYLDEIHPEPPLLPAGARARERARAREIALIVEADIHPLWQLEDHSPYASTRGAFVLSADCCSSSVATMPSGTLAQGGHPGRDRMRVGPYADSRESVTPIGCPYRSL